MASGQEQHALKKAVKELDEQLGLIRDKGRQVFLQSQPKNFTRILHDYTDEKKGFTVWKHLLEEQIV